MKVSRFLLHVLATPAEALVIAPRTPLPIVLTSATTSAFEVSTNRHTARRSVRQARAIMMNEREISDGETAARWVGLQGAVDLTCVVHSNCARPTRLHAAIRSIGTRAHLPHMPLSAAKVTAEPTVTIPAHQDRWGIRVSL